MGTFSQPTCREVFDCCSATGAEKSGGLFHKTGGWGFNNTQIKKTHDALR